MNRLFILPEDRTISYLQDVFQAGPIQINWEGLGVEIATSSRDISVNPNGRYRCLPGSMGSWYDTATAMSYLILPLFPEPKLAKRHKDIGDAFGRSFIPYMVISGNVGNSRRTKAWINSVATGLVDSQPLLYFGDEVVLQDASTVAAHRDFYFDYHSRGAVSNQVFLEEDEGTD